MKLIILYLILCCFLNPTCSEIYYVTPDSGNCTVNGTTLTPCYTLQQLIEDEVLPSSNESLVTLLLLSGNHLMLVNMTFRIFNISEVAIHPLNEEQEVAIECPLGANQNFIFHNITNLTISSLRFSSCTLQYSCEINSKPARSVNITRCTFEGSANRYAISITNTDIKLDFAISNCTFSLNGAIDATCNGCSDTPLTARLLITGTLFQGNVVTTGHGGGALHIEHMIVIVNESQFIKNTANFGGGAIYAKLSSLILNSTTFYENYIHYWGGEGDGSAIYSERSSVEIDSCHFINNSAERDGTVSIRIASQPVFITSTMFQGNHANRQGGAFRIYNAQVTIKECLLKNNSAVEGGGIYCFGYCNVNIVGGHSILNSAEENGGFAYLFNGQLIISSHDYAISSNRASNGGAIYASQSTINIHHNTAVTNNTAAQCGGAFYLTNAYIFIPNDAGASLKFDHNAAIDKGGAIFVLNRNCEAVSYHSQCFLHDYWEQKYLLYFANNNASLGPILYGGLLDRCLTSSDGTLGIDHIKDVSKYKSTPLAITSDPVRVCLCDEHLTLNCTKRNLTISKMKGQTIHLSGTTVDQDNNSKASFIRAGYSQSASVLGEGEEREETGTKCSKLLYHVFVSNNISATLSLQPEGYCELSNFSKITVHINIVPCIRGFEDYGNRCDCDKRLQTNHFNVTGCDINMDSIRRKGSIWLRYDEHYLKVHGNCPLDYCNMTSDTISLAHPDEQCANHHSGVICGACQDNYSIALGGSKCLECTSSYSSLIWLIPVFAMAGIVLVAFLWVCNMTVSHGTLNGLIFYANIVSMAGLTSLQNCSLHPILSVFIAWLNLDFGVETCFYSGMDSYQKTWLQFVFPLYIWLLVGVIILVSHYSTSAMKIFGRNNIAILATLFLLSYTKILKTIITALNFTEVFQGSADDTSDQLVPYKVWTYDGNIEYLKGKHVPLFAVALALLVFLFLPYTLLLTFGQCIRSLPTQKRYVLRCIRSTAFISIMDAYHAPYNKKHRYWTGLMLLARCVLFLAFASSNNDNQLLANMYITTLVLVAILTLKSSIKRVYRNYRYMNLLETCFLLNLVVLSTTLYYLRGNSSSDHTLCTCTSASISVSMLIFVGMLAYHTQLQISKTKCFTSIKVTILAQWHTRQYHIIPTEGNVPSNPVQQLPTTTTVEVRKEFLDIEGIDIVNP